MLSVSVPSPRTSIPSINFSQKIETMRRLTNSSGILYHLQQSSSPVFIHKIDIFLFRFSILSTSPNVLQWKAKNHHPLKSFRSWRKVLKFHPPSGIPPLPLSSFLFPLPTGRHSTAAVFSRSKSDNESQWVTILLRNCFQGDFTQVETLQNPSNSQINLVEDHSFCHLSEQLFPSVNKFSIIQPIVWKSSARYRACSVHNPLQRGGRPETDGLFRISRIAVTTKDPFGATTAFAIEMPRSSQHFVGKCPIDISSKPHNDVNIIWIDSLHNSGKTLTKTSVRMADVCFDYSLKKKKKKKKNDGKAGNHPQFDWTRSTFRYRKTQIADRRTSEADGELLTAASSTC
jgi:hypothetical protein